MKQDAADIIAEQREAQLGGVKQKRRAAQRKTGIEVAGASLIVGERAIRGSAACKEIAQYAPERCSGSIDDK
jgi:hypothetical protein